MHSNITHGRALAMVAGMAFTVGSLVILMGDVLTKPQAWERYHVLTVLTVFGVIASGHLMATAGSAKRLLSALGFGVLFLAGTMLVVYNSVGRQAEVTEAKALSAEATNATLAAKLAELDKAKARRDDAEAQVAYEIAGRPDKKTGKPTAKAGCGGNCQDWKQRAKEVSGYITTLESQIAALGPQKPVNPKAEKMAAVIALFGGNEAKAAAALALLEPFLWTLFFEIGSIVSLGFAFRSDKRVAQAPAANDAEPLPPARAFEPELKGAEVIAWAQAFERKHGRAPRLDEAQAAFPSVARTTVYRRLKAA